MSPGPSEILADPTLLLHRVDPARRRLLFRRTTAEAVRDSAFIDGRTDIWVGEPAELPFSAALELKPAPEPNRYVFHMSFSGSTLLARLIDRPGKALSLREPNCLVDLADWRSALAASGSADADFDPMLRFARAMIGRPWAGGEAVLIKPSSWVNNLIGDLTQPGLRAMFVTIARDEFLEAVLRGGRDRLAFTARLAAHLSPFVERGPDRLQAAIDSTDDAVGKAARLAVVAHDLQLRLFERAGARESCSVDFSAIRSDPARAASVAATALAVNVDAGDIAINCERWARANAKADAAYSGEQRRSENERVRAHYGELIEAALDWGAGALGAAQLERSA